MMSRHSQSPSEWEGRDDLPCQNSEGGKTRTTQPHLQGWKLNQSKLLIGEGLRSKVFLLKVGQDEREEGDFLATRGARGLLRLSKMENTRRERKCDLGLD